ncbi:MAG: GNAT family N-acetyltransferase [Novosphingobium sp.]|nr:GNAT family N-acetyltransferase [Novosphingobium sp.]MCP5404476.1 GNAT family N-acetyltransferase [Novosphingobium sp.]
MFIRSERLFLRPGWPEDWEELLALINDEEVVRNLAAVPWPYTAEHAREFICRPREKLLPHFFVTVPARQGAKLIGSIGLGHDGDDVELGYWIARDHWGQGYATEALRAVLRLCTALGHQRVVANHFADNGASARVLEKAGFTPTGETRMRFSAGRGGEAPVLCYEKPLVGGETAQDRASLAA